MGTRLSDESILDFLKNASALTTVNPVFVEALCQRLEDANALCRAAEKMQYHGGEFETRERGVVEGPIGVEANRELRKAIRKYRRLEED